MCKDKCNQLCRESYSELHKLHLKCSQILPFNWKATPESHFNDENNRHKKLIFGNSCFCLSCLRVESHGNDKEKASKSVMVHCVCSCTTSQLGKVHSAAHTSRLPICLPFCIYSCKFCVGLRFILHHHFS